MPTTQYEFQRLPDDLKQLVTRSETIERIRQSFFDALRKGDDDARKSALSQAENAGVELSDHVPIYLIEELEAIRQLANELQGSLEDLKGAERLAELKDEDVPALLDKLNELKQAITESEGLLEKSRIAHEQIENNKRELEQRTQVLVVTRILDALLMLRLTTPRDYERRARSALSEAQLDLENIQSEQQRILVNEEISRAKKELDQWQQLQRNNPNLTGNLEDIQNVLHANGDMQPEQKEQFISFLQTCDPVPGVIARLAALNNDVSVTSTQQQPTFSIEAQTAVNEWWQTWHRIGQPPAEQGGESKRQQIEQLQKKCLPFQETYSERQNPAVQEVFIAWRRRSGQALNAVEFLEEIAVDVSSTAAALSPMEGALLMNRMDDAWMMLAPEVYWLFAVEWGTTYQKLVQKTSVEPVQNDDGISLAAKQTELPDKQIARMAQKRKEGQRIVTMFVTETSPEQAAPPRMERQVDSMPDYSTPYPAQDTKSEHQNDWYDFGQPGQLGGNP